MLYMAVGEGSMYYQNVIVVIGMAYLAWEHFRFGLGDKGNDLCYGRT